MPRIQTVKEYLRLDSDITEAESAYIHTLILLSAEICEHYTRLPLPEELPESYEMAMLMIIGYFFENREGTKSGLPAAVWHLLNPYRKAAF